MGMSFDVQHDGTVTPVVLHCFGRHNILYALAAFAAGKLIGMTDKEITDGIARYRTSGIRQNLVSYGGVRLYLDCYNASVESMQSALSTVSAIPVSGQGRRIAVLADIKEGGADVVEYHRQVGPCRRCIPVQRPGSATGTMPAISPKKPVPMRRWTFTISPRRQN